MSAVGLPGGVQQGATYNTANQLTQWTLSGGPSSLSNTYNYAYDATGWVNSELRRMASRISVG